MISDEALYNQGGYDDGYLGCPCFWGTKPSSLVTALLEHLQSVDGMTVLDAGCGEGKNAVFLANRGAKVEAVDISAAAIENAIGHWGEVGGVSWIRGDIRSIEWPESHYDVVIAYGLFHCLASPCEIIEMAAKLRSTLRPTGYMVVCTFNDRFQDLSAHPGFSPCLLGHDQYVRLFSDWDFLVETDSDLRESRPHNNVEHVHSMSRILVRKVS